MKCDCGVCGSYEYSLRRFAGLEPKEKKVPEHSKRIEVWHDRNYGWRAQYFDGDYTAGPFDALDAEQAVRFALHFATNYALGGK